jgi:uncharacterized protein YciI
MSHFVLTYELAPDYLERRSQFRSQHLQFAWEASDRGELMLAGAVGEPPESALLLFTDQNAAEAFARSDPYVREGLITKWRVRPWTTVVGEGCATPVRP